jgi:YfiH family protein
VSIPQREPVEEFAAHGITAFTTTRGAGSFGTSGGEAVSEVLGRWWALVDELHLRAPRFVSARQVHGTRVVVHGTAWEGWLRVPEADGHIATEPGTALVVTVADCVPVFVAHPSGAVALLHAGWRGTAAGILGAALDTLSSLGLPPRELLVHLGPAICGRCYEVGPDVHAQLTGRTVSCPTTVDLRSLLATQAHTAGVRHISTSPHCTRCHNDRFYSYRGGDGGRQVGVVVSTSDSRLLS